MKRAVIVFSDYACPWCYLGRARLLQAVEHHDVDIQVVHYPLSTDTPLEGSPVRPYLEAKGIDVDEAVARLSALLAEAGLPYLGDADRMHRYNTRRAQELAIWAVTQPGGDAIHDALFRAYHVDNVNLSDIDVLLGIVAGLGLDVDEARDVLTAGRSARTLEAHWALADRVRVTAVPTYMIGRKGLVGAQPVETIERLVAQSVKA